MFATFIPIIGDVVSAVLASIEKNDYNVDVSARYKSLDKESKNEIIQSLSEHGVSQRRIAKSLGISASAVSQRLKNSVQPVVKNNDCISKLYELKCIGLSNQAIAKLISNTKLEVTQEDVASFFQVLEASKKHLK